MYRPSPNAKRTVSPPYKNGEKEEVDRYYYDGKLSIESAYENGELISRKQF